jgi:opacity protein-like surface antigen
MKKFLIVVALFVASLTAASAADGFDPASSVFVGGRNTNTKPPQYLNWCLGRNGTTSWQNPVPGIAQLNCTLPTDNGEVTFQIHFHQTRPGRVALESIDTDAGEFLTPAMVADVIAEVKTYAGASK